MPTFPDAPKTDTSSRNERTARTRGPVKRFISEVLELRHTDVRTYWWCKLTGQSYATFYTARMDRLAKVTPETATGIPEHKKFQLDYLVRCGMTPQSTLLDLGCGTGSAAVNFIKYLNPDCYVGADISSGCLEVARTRMDETGLADSRPVFEHLPDGDLSGLDGQRFDFMWAHSVFTHMPPEDIKACLTALRKLMHPGSRFCATFAQTSGEPLNHRCKDWYYNSQFFIDTAAECGLTCQIMDDWSHPVSAIDTVASFRPDTAVSAAAA